jgi:hypothetical protein
MKKVLTFLFGLVQRLTGGYEQIHNDALRANQGGRAPGFSFWRALVS